MSATITKSSVRDTQTEIGRRLREVRRHLRISATAFAKTCGIPRPTLDSYEDGRSRVSAALVFRAWRHWFISPTFLGSGEGLRMMPFPSGITLPRVADDVRFDEIYPKLIPFFDAVENDLKASRLATVEDFLVAAREDRTPRGALAVVAHTIHQHDPRSSRIKIAPTP